MTEITEKIQNEETKITETNEEKMRRPSASGRTCGGGRPPHLTFVRLRLLRSFVLNLLRCLRPLEHA